MFQSLKLGKFFGIDLFVHGTFWLLPLFVLFSGVTGGLSLGGIVWDLAFLFAVFGCVVLHEVGHALAARAYGIGTRDITLYPVGGVASLQRMPEKPGQEIAIALAGPAVNVVIAAALFAGFLGATYLTPWTPTLETADSVTILMANLTFANLFLAGFNLLPAFPMDGGRVLRALLATRLNRVRATEIAVSVGTVVAGGFLVVGLVNKVQFGLIAIAVVVFLLSQAELAAVRARAVAREWGDRVTDWVTPAERTSPVSPDFSGLAWDSARNKWVEYRHGHPIGVIDSKT